MRVLGMISGTSHDAVELAVAELRIDADTIYVTALGASSVEFPTQLRSRLVTALPPASTTLGEVCRLDTELGQLFGAAAKQGVAELAGGAADLVVSHGQTVYHWVDGGDALGTLQLGAPAWIAEACGCPVISDLRTRDITRGGHGAPLVAVLDQLLILGSEESRGSLNLGGIANVTVRRAGTVLAWDVGPANALIDAAVAELTGGTEAMDDSGRRAASGRVRADLLAAFLDEPYYALPPPKSTGKELFHTGYVAEHVARVDASSGSPVAADDLVATLTELTATLVGGVCRADGLTELVVAGGGCRNPTLMDRLRDHCAPTSVSPVETYGLPSSGKEAYAFALLGFLSVHGLPGTIASATGASTPSILGSLTPGAGPLRLPAPAEAMPTRMVLVE